MIDHITKHIWTQPDGKMGFCYHVYYKGKGWRQNRHYCYTWQQNLPMTIVNYIMNASECDTLYTDTGKRETYRA